MSTSRIPSLYLTAKTTNTSAHSYPKSYQISRNLTPSSETNLISPTFLSTKLQPTFLMNQTKLADFEAAVSTGEVQELQGVLESLVVDDRLRKALLVLKKELINAQLQSKLSRDVDSKIAKRQHEYYLMEQLKGIKKELGMESDGKDKLIEKFKERAASSKLQGFGGGVSSPSSSCLLYFCAKRFLFCQIKAFLFSLSLTLNCCALSWNEAVLVTIQGSQSTGGAQRPLNTRSLIPRYGWSFHSRGEFFYKDAPPPSQPGNNFRPKYNDVTLFRYWQHHGFTCRRCLTGLHQNHG